jgi:hypothetical protein
MGLAPPAPTPAEILDFLTLERGQFVPPFCITNNPFGAAIRCHFWAGLGAIRAGWFEVQARIRGEPAELLMLPPKSGPEEARIVGALQFSRH